MPALRLLVAIDFSAGWEAAIARGLALSADTGARLRIVHVADDALPPALVAQSLAFARGAIAEAVAAADPQPEVEILAADDPAEAIAAGAAGWGADLVLLAHSPRRATHAQRGVRGMAAQLLVLLRRPLLIVRRPVGGAYRSAVVGVDFSIFARSALRWAHRLAPDAALHLVHAYVAPFAARLPAERYGAAFAAAERAEVDAYFAAEMDWLRQRALAAGVPAGRVETSVREGLAEDVLPAIVAETASDLLAVGSHGRTGLSRMFAGSVAEALLADPPADLLVVPIAA
jgi:nucleotide-binding universal stress UspA family protein